MTTTSTYETRETADTINKRETGSRSRMKLLLAQTRARELDRMEDATRELIRLRDAGETRSNSWYRQQLEIAQSRLAYDSAAQAERGLEARGY